MAVAIKAKGIKYGEIEKEFSKIPLTFFRVTEKFLNGDHWQNRNGWIGWIPETESKTASDDWNRLLKNFTPKNVILGIIKRLEGAIMGKEPDWQVISTDESKEVDADNRPKLTAEQQTIKEIDSLMVDWWTNKNVHQKFKDYLRNKKAYGKACMRIYIPTGYIQADGSLGTTDLAEVLDMIYVEVPKYDAFVDIQDNNYGKKFVVIAVKSDTTNKVSYEINYVNEKKEAVLRILEGKQGTQVDVQPTKPIITERDARQLNNELIAPMLEDEPNKNTSNEITIDLGGNNLCYVSGEYNTALISEPVHRQQRQVNHAKTMEGYALLNINFPETIFFNANMREQYTDEATGAVKERDMKPVRGAGRWLNLKGLVLQALDRETITTPTVHYREPADPSKFAQVADNNARDMHQETGMAYIGMIDSPYPSGDARVEAMNDYIILLVDSKTDEDTLGVWCITSVLRLALSFAEKEKQALAKKFKVVFESNITLGKIGNEDKVTMMTEVDKGLRTKRSYMIVSQSSDNPDADLLVIASDKAEQQATDIKQAGEMAKATFIEKPAT